MSLKREAQVMKDLETVRGGPAQELLEMPDFLSNEMDSLNQRLHSLNQFTMPDEDAVRSTHSLIILPFLNCSIFLL